MPDRPHHSAEQYGCPTATYCLLVTAGHLGALIPFAWSTDLDELRERAAPVAGVIVQLPVVACHLPAPQEWSL